MVREDRHGEVRPIGTPPGYYQAGLSSDGDPALAFGPRKGPGGFSWANGSRLYYATLTANFSGTEPIKGLEAIAVSRSDDVRAVWNDVRGAQNCPAIDAYRASLLTQHPLPAPAPLRDCPPRFGNTDIYGGSYADPTR